MPTRDAAALLPVPATRSTGAADRIGHAIVEFLGRVPESRLEPHAHPAGAARSHARQAAGAAALAAGALSLPPGALGWLTLVPEMVGVWRIQAQLVADIARLYGRTPTVTRSQMLFCLFRHSAAQAFRDLVVRAGERVLVRNASLRAIQAMARQVGVKLSPRAVAGAVARWVPVIGAVGVGAYAYRDTMQVARTAIALFEADAGGSLPGSFLSASEPVDIDFVEARVFDAEPGDPEPTPPRRRRRP